MKITVERLREMKREGRKIAAVLAYDFRTLQILDRSDVDVALVGDSAGVNIFGHDDAAETTTEELALLCRGAVRAVHRALLLVDLPPATYDGRAERAVAHARRFQDLGVDGVKVEAPAGQELIVEAIARAGIPVLAHFGATPSQHTEPGGFEAARARIGDDQLVDQARLLERAGAFALDLTMGGAATKRVVEAVEIPVLGGRGTTADSDGQFLQINRLVGWSAAAIEDGVERYAHLGRSLRDALNSYAADVRAGKLALGRG